jgi:hypothetical protein
VAIINVSFDTSSKDLTVSIDGTSLDNVQGVNFSQAWDDEDEFRCCITTFAEDEATEIKSMTQLYAAETAAAKNLIDGKPSEKFPEFIQSVPEMENKVFKQIAQYFQE